ncbi:protein kinase C delta type-like [Engystomops pustulosus]|uniref:protein kinase C delta type-like n=1 Tax=Engystomops pustulosus TaxID=76066 RepID=UPI003AFB29E7
MSPPSGKKGKGKKRKRESESDKENQPKKKITTISDVEKNISSPASSHVQDHVPSKHRSGGQKRKLQKEEEEAYKKLKLDDDGASTSTSTIAPRGLARFAFHQVLGRGAFGSVYLASLKDKKSTVAIKAIAKKEEDTLLLREKRVLQRLAGNPYICRLFATFQTSSYAFMVMELLPGGNLENKLQEQGRLDDKTTALCTAQIICGLQHMHKHGIIHRDLKTANITIDHKGNIRICDFGLAVENVYGAETIFEGAGTPYYKAPEMLNFKPYGSSADWWSFGILLYRLLTNTYPYAECKTVYKLWQMMQKRKPIYPDYLSEEAKDILPKLLCHEHRIRLGYFGDIRQHPFYTNIDWEKVENNTIDPPFPPWMDTCPSTSLLSDLPFFRDLEGECSHPAVKAIPEFSHEDPDWPL